MDLVICSSAAPEEERPKQPVLPDAPPTAIAGHLARVAAAWSALAEAAAELELRILHARRELSKRQVDDLSGRLPFRLSRSQRLLTVVRWAASGDPGCPIPRRRSGRKTPASDDRPGPSATQPHGGQNSIR